MGSEFSNHTYENIIVDCDECHEEMHTAGEMSTMGRHGLRGGLSDNPEVI